MGVTGSIPEQYTKPEGEGLKPNSDNPNGFNLRKETVLPKTATPGAVKPKNTLKNVEKPKESSIFNIFKKPAAASAIIAGGKRTQKNKKKVKFSRKTNSVRKL